MSTTPLSSDALAQVRAMLNDPISIPSEMPATILLRGTARKLLVTLDHVRDEYQRFYDFVGDSDPAIVDAWHFGENVRVQQEARDAQSAAATTTPDPQASVVSDTEGEGTVP